MASHGFETFDYGNFDRDDADLTSTTKHGWYTYDHRPRYGTNYFGLRGRISILSEAYSHDPFARRVRSTYAFVSQILSAAVRHEASIERLRSEVTIVPGIPLGGTLTSRPIQATLAFEILTRTGDSALTQPGVPRGLRRTGKYRRQRMPVYARFDAERTVESPIQYLIKGADSAVVALIRQHGVDIEPISHDTTDTVEVFVIDSIVPSERAYQGHRQTRVVGRWTMRVVTMGPGDFVVTPGVRFAALAAYLLDPESDDGLLNWNVFDRSLKIGGSYPVFRLSY
jgi:hypothetical protein